MGVDVIQVSSHRRSINNDELKGSQSGNSVVVILTRLLDDPNVEIRTKVIEGMCKLLMIRSVVSGKLLSRQEVDVLLLDEFVT